MAIIEALLSSLNLQACGESDVALNLERLYIYMMKEITAIKKEGAGSTPAPSRCGEGYEI